MGTEHRPATLEGFSAEIAAVRRRAAQLEREAGGATPELLEEALAELQTALENLSVAEEELRVQNETLFEAQLGLELERARYHDLFEFAPDGYLLTDEACVIREANRAAGRLLGVEPRFLSGKPLAVFLEAPAAVLDWLRSPPRASAPPLATRLCPRGRPPFDAALTVAPSEAGAGEPRLRWLLRDVSERRRAEEALARQAAELERRTAELEAKNAEQESFVYTVSHDLRAPLLSIQGMASLLAEAVASGDAEEAGFFLSRVTGNVEKMGALLDDLLALSRAGRLEEEAEVFSLGEAVGQALGELEERLAARGVTVSLPESWPEVRYPRSEAYQIVANLLGNAAKFAGRPGEPRRVAVAWSVDGPRLTLRVSDNGPGVPPPQRERVWQLFQKLDPKSPGTGVGLAIVKRIASRHGGAAWVEDSPPPPRGLGGACFAVTLPLERRHGPDPAYGGPERRRKEGR